VLWEYAAAVAVSLRTRPMSSLEFESFRARSVRDFAASQVEAGNWTVEVAEHNAMNMFDQLLPEGLATEGHLVLSAEDADGTVIGSVWVALHRPDTSGAWVYDIFVEPQHRGKGVGRALLTAAENDVLQRGVDSIGLNVFGGNDIARRLYESAGYETTTMQMRKTL